MAQRMQVPELLCMEPENYRKYFRALCWSGTKKDKKNNKKLTKKDKLRKSRAANTHPLCFAPSFLGNASPFAVFANVRSTILSRCRQYPGPIYDFSDDSDSEDSSQLPIGKLPKVTGIGLKAVFALIAQSRFTNETLCQEALTALLDVLQGLAPEELAQEPTEIVNNLQAMLVDVANAAVGEEIVDVPSTLTALATSCLVALTVARGETELMVKTIRSLIVTKPYLSEQEVQVPANLITLQRSVQSVILGSPSRNQWLNFGVPQECLVNSFPVELPASLTAGAGELIVRSLISDGNYLFVYTSKGLVKFGSGYGSSIKQHMYMLAKPDFFPGERHGWLGLCKDKLYLRVGRKKTEVYEVDKDSLEVRSLIRLDPGQPAPVEPKSAVFTDGNQLGLILLTNYNNLTIRMYDPTIQQERVEGTATPTLVSQKDIHVHLLRRRTLVLGRSPFEDGYSRRAAEVDTPVALQLDDCDEDPLLSIHAGQDFALLTTVSGKVYYTGKGQGLGYKAASPTGRWTLMKETIFSRNEAPNAKRCKVIQVAVGHEGVHAILVLDNGTALFTGIARRGEDGDALKHRRTPKPTRPKKIFRAEGHHIIYAACNYGSTALVTRQGVLLMFGKDTQHCDSAGQVTGLRHERIIQVALGKAHAVALTSFGQVYTLGINNKGQCGREFGYTKEKVYLSRRKTEPEPKEDSSICTGAHNWTTDYCRVCVLCRECTGFSSACHCSHLPNRVPSERCGCGEGDSGCAICGICRRCADAFATASRPERVTVTDLDDDADTSTRSDSRNEKESSRFTSYEGHATNSEGERDTSLKVSSLPPARIAVPGGHRIAAVACGLHHTVLLTDQGDVFTFGSNQYGQLGAGDVSVHHRIIRVRVPRAGGVAAGSNHTAVITRDGELYTFGSYQKGALGRPRMEEPTTRTDRSPIWFATPGRVPRLGPRHSCKAVSVTASGDQTFVQVSQALIKTDTLFGSTITANNNCIMILPNRPEHTFKCITINRTDGTCNTWTGTEQADFVNSLACLDPLYDVLWCYQPQMKVMKCYNILAYDSHKLQKCCNEPDSYFGSGEYEYPNYGPMKRLEDFQNLENFDLSCSNEDRPTDTVVLSNTSILNQELAIPSVSGCMVTRMHAALHLLGCLDSLIYAHDMRLNQSDCRRESTPLPILPVKEDFLTVNRFESHGGGWGYSGHSVEAIRFMCDTDILLGGFGLFGGRGDYTAKIKLFDIGLEGGDQEGDGELMAESDEVVYECPPRDRYPVLFDSPIPLMANRWYVAWACISGPSSDCGSSGQAMVINDEVGFHFKTSKKSNNGTDVNAGQIPCLLYNTVSPDQGYPLKSVDYGEPVIMLSKNMSRKVTVHCFIPLMMLLDWSWRSHNTLLLDTNGLLPINFDKLEMMQHQKRLVYIARACLRILKSYINDIYPQNNRKRNSHEYMSYFDSIANVRNLVQRILSGQTPTCSMLPKRAVKNKAQRICYVQFALDLTTTIFKEAHETITACFHAFFPTPTLKWNHLCSLLANVKDGVVPPTQIRELTATCAAMCSSKSLRDVLQYVVPLTQNYINTNENRRPDSKVIIKEVPSKSATVPRSSHSAQKPPPIPPRANRNQPKPPEPVENNENYKDWHLLDVIPRLLDIVMIPIKQQMMTPQCGQPHDHGEIKERETLSEYCCKLTARIISELSTSATSVREDIDSNTVKHLITPSRFMRVNQSRAWNTGNGSPDAICFTVDRAGVMLVGVCVYGGLGNYDYSLELLHDVRLRASSDDTNPTHCWVSVETTHGSFSSGDLQHDMVQIKFDRPVPLKEDLRYALKLCNQGGRTANGDCGLPSVKGPDGTTFRFASCSLSYNGTTLARGQIPSLIYYGTSKSISNSSESVDSLITSLRTLTLHVASIIIERAADMFCTLRNELTAEDLRRNANVLQSSPAINILIPYTLANLEGVDDSKSLIKLLEMIHKLVAHVAAMNLLVPNTEEPVAMTAQHYAWVESDHPYKQASVTNMRVLFPPTVSWIALEMDPRCITAQPEDTLTVYAVANTPKHRCHCANEVRVTDPPFRKRLIQLSNDGDVEEIGEDLDADGVCTHYNCTYVSVTPKLSNNPSEWSTKALLVPGNEVIFSLDTASDYLTEYNKSDNNEDNRYGFRCLCVGYEDTALTTNRQGLVALEMELVYAGAAAAHKLLVPVVDIPPVTYSTLVDVHVNAVTHGSPMGAEGEFSQDSSEALLLSRGLELSSPPTIHHVLDGQPLLRCVSTERQFLTDFVAGAESTAGGRLARWLAPTSRVEPSKCELKAPTFPVRPSMKVTLPILIRDQYGENVASPALKVEVVVQRLSSIDNRASNIDPDHMKIPDVPYQPTIKDGMSFNAITMMRAYQNYSFEELRLASESWGEGGAIGGTFMQAGRIPAERLPVRENQDGSYNALWTPRFPGLYLFRCSLDDQPAAQEVKVEVMENMEIPAAERGVQAGGTLPMTPPPKRRRFGTRYTSGLRVRASPSLQAEEIGRVPPGGYVAFLEELKNKDGTWVRLNEDSMEAYTDGGVEVAWCLQHHGHMDRVLLTPVEPTTPPSQSSETSQPSQTQPQPVFTARWTGYSDAQGDDESWTQEDEDALVEITCFDDRKVHNQAITCGASVEPNKLDRIFRAEASPTHSASNSPKRMQRRSNGNSDEWWSSIRRFGENGDANVIQETDIEPEPLIGDRSSRVAQTGTQTSPDKNNEVAAVQLYMSKVLAEDQDRLSPKSKARERLSNRTRPYKRASSSPPSLPSSVPHRTAPGPPPPRKHALSPAQAECLRAIFAALLWHEGIVHDAIACATFLKFHPELPKQGARVVTRPSQDPTPRHQRHSVEVSNAVQYLRIHPSALETLTRSGEEASASRMRKSDVDGIINEEEIPATCHEHGDRNVVNVLPPALRALVALWDALYDADQLTSATDKIQNEDKRDNDLSKLMNNIPKKREWNTKKTGRAPLIGALHTFTVVCDLCGGKNVPPPLATHMRNTHPGCQIITTHGFDRTGNYKRVEAPPGHAPLPPTTCGQMGQSYQLFYMFCEKCHEKTLRAISLVRQTKAKCATEDQYRRLQQAMSLDHHTLRENAIFLLDLAPLTTPENISLSLWSENISRGPPTPPGSMWQPAPPFQCLQALGAAPKPYASDPARYHSLGRPAPVSIDTHPSTSREMSSLSPSKRVHRSVSMGQAGGRDLAHAVQPPLIIDSDSEQETLSGVGSSLLSQPSASLRRIIGWGDWATGGSLSVVEVPRVDSEALMNCPVLSFILAKRDLHSHRQKMDAVVRINTVRQYAFEALNWLLRSATQPTCVHDVMWWYCHSLEKFAKIEPATVPNDNKPNVSNENNRNPKSIPTACTSAICPGGRAGRGARAAFHSFLGSVSALAPSLPAASAAGLQAVRCWALNYSPHDRSFLHRSQVFSVISKILSHSEDAAHEEGAIHESFHSYLNKESYVWDCSNVTGWCDISVSSRQGMAPALTDGSTETFWESGDEDRNKAKWIQMTYPGGTPSDRPHILAVHIDNTRDTSHKTLLVSFLYSGGSGDMFHMQDVEVDTRSANWICYTMPRCSNSSVRVRCELRGPEPAVRVRQVRVLGAPSLKHEAAVTPANVLHAQSEADTLRVFRLLTSQVFGKLLEYDRNGSDSEAETSAVVEDPTVDDSDLREHVVGILFAGHKLTSLQKQVMSHIVSAINCEATRVRDDWETALLCADAALRSEEEQPVKPPPQDNYCFEMLSLLQALSGSAVGRAHLAQRTELLADLLALLHTGSERVQRQIISLLRRMIMEVPPQKMLAVANYGTDLNSSARVTFLDHLAAYLGKAISLQVKIKGTSGLSPSTVMMGNTVTQNPPATWFMRGETPNKHAHLVARLMLDMAEDKITPDWGAETRQALTSYISLVAQMSEADRRPARCIASPTVWRALAALCVCQQAHVEIINGPAEGRESRRGEAEGRRHCANHDDGSTLAVIECRTCGPLCAECDRFLHLNRAARSHQRQICKEEESSIRVDIHEGCGRAKLFWLLLLIDRRTLKALSEFRGMDNPVCENTGEGTPSVSGPPGLAGTCRFCGTRGSSGLLAIGNVCADQQCQEYAKEACNRVLPCGHLCGGVRGERTCLPCLFGCVITDVAAVPLRQDADDMCMICFTDPLQAAPALQLNCGHVFHLHCCKKVLANKWNGPRITFSFSQCPICKKDMSHWTLEELLTPIRQLRDEVQRKSLMRLQYEGVTIPSGAGSSKSAVPTDPATYAMERYAYYVCHKCAKAYFGGLARCEAESNGFWEPAELVCGACSDVAGARTCPKHGSDFLEYKCRYCCSVAVFFCFGTSHFCNSCHDDFQRVTNIPKHLLPQCPAGPKGVQLPGTSDECPLHVQHPPTGEEFALGCGVCRHSQAF